MLWTKMMRSVRTSDMAIWSSSVMQSILESLRCLACFETSISIALELSNQKRVGSRPHRSSSRWLICQIILSIKLASQLCIGPVLSPSLQPQRASVLYLYVKNYSLALWATIGVCSNTKCSMRSCDLPTVKNAASESSMLTVARLKIWSQLPYIN